MAPSSQADHCTPPKSFSTILQRPFSIFAGSYHPLTPTKASSTLLIRPATAILLAIAFISCSNLLAYLIFSHTDNRNLHHIPDSRFTRSPSHRLNFTRPLFVSPTLHQSAHRAYISIFPHLASDGMGNGFTTINYDYLFAQFLNVSYIHRDAHYNSLSPDHDPIAIERLFGWDDYPYIRSKMISHICDKWEVRQGPACADDGAYDPSKFSHLQVCVQLRNGGPFKRIVTIPHNLSDCLVGRLTTECRVGIAHFSAQHPHHGTLFQMAPHRCATKYRIPDFRRSGAWFRHRYWTRHRNSTATVAGKGVTRVLSGFRPKQIQIAVHIRRGDFFLAKNRILVADGVYANVVATVARITKRLLGSSFSIRATIYSEGVPMEGERLGHTHDVTKTESIYVDENETRHGDGQSHWEALLREHGSDDVQVSMRVGSDTIDAIHGMSCADIFIGSMSSLSRTVVTELSRGVVIVPSTRDQFEDISNKGHWRLYFVHDDDTLPVVDEMAIEGRLLKVLPVEHSESTGAS